MRVLESVRKRLPVRSALQNCLLRNFLSGERAFLRGSLQNLVEAGHNLAFLEFAGHLAQLAAGFSYLGYFGHVFNDVDAVDLEVTGQLA